MSDDIVVYLDDDVLDEHGEIGFSFIKNLGDPDYEEPKANFVRACRVARLMQKSDKCFFERFKTDYNV